MRRGIFIDEIYWSDGMMHLKFHGPTDFTRDNYKLNVTLSDRGVVNGGSYSVKPWVTYRFGGLRTSANAIWRIELEECLAYYGPIPSTSGLVVA